MQMYSFVGSKCTISFLGEIKKELIIKAISTCSNRARALSCLNTAQVGSALIQAEVMAIGQTLFNM